MNVPKLRFKEFTDEWSNKKLNEIVKFSKGNILSKADLNNEGQYPCILYGQLYTKYHEVIKEILGRTDRNDKNLIKSKYGDILIPSSGETPIDISTSSCVLLDNILIGGDINILSPINSDGRFISYMISNNKKFEIAKVAQGHSIVHLYNENLKSIKLSIPSKDEQTKIANFLSLLDKKIELQTKKVEDLKLYKLLLLKYLLRKYNTKKIMLKDVCKIYAGGTPSTSNEKYWNGNIKWIQSGLIKNCLINSDNIEKTITELGLNKSSAKMIKPNTTLLAMTGATCGNTAFLECEACANQSVMAFETKKVNSKFIYYLFQNNKKYILKFQAGGAQSGINKSSCESLEFDFPNIELQNKIVKILDHCEEQLSNNILKLSKLQKLKKGLMQIMFV